MLEDYHDGQPVAYDILKKSIENKTIAHAYLFYSDNADVAFDFALCYAKTLLCPDNKLNTKTCDNCSICHRINNNNFPELKIVSPEGLWIKKDQLLNLQEEFRMKPLEGNKKVYIINNANQLNAQSANSMLKFLEEPEPNIIALLTTSDMNGILPTIVSRCQLIKVMSNSNIRNSYDNISNKSLIKIGELYYKNESDLKDFLENDKSVIKLDAVINFIRKYELLKLDVLLEVKKLWQNYFIDKEDYLLAFDIMVFFYKDVLNFMYNRDLEIFDYYKSVIEKAVSLNKIEDIIYKLQKILLTKEKIKYNMNLSLLMDKLIIEMESR